MPTYQFLCHDIIFEMNQRSGRRLNPRGVMYGLINSLVTFVGEISQLRKSAIRHDRTKTRLQLRLKFNVYMPPSTIVRRKEFETGAKMSTTLVIEIITQISRWTEKKRK